MIRTSLIIAAVVLSGCNATIPGVTPRPVSTTPLPKDEMVSVANYSNIAASQEIALDQAKDFCMHWGAAPGVTKSETVDLLETKTAGDTANNMAKTAIKTGKLFDDGQRYRTTLTYKCY